MNLGELRESVEDAVLTRVGRASARLQERRGLDADLLESEDAFLVVMDAPGAERDDVQVRFRDGAVDVRIDRFREFHEGFETRVPGRGLSLDGHVDLPEGARVDPDGADATLTDAGVLEIQVPKSEDARGRVGADDGTTGDDGDDGPIRIETDGTDDTDGTDADDDGG
ncbi:molecular chaperone Hsp20 [Halobacteriales archaeon SW_7_68_16]|nr:MAG: molecular chaperone Hsp20 [Halobacteriales archaeon SW_7_68_16]